VKNSSRNIFILDAAARNFPDAPALITQRRVITYSRYLLHAVHAARKLQECGIDSGSRVAVLCPRRLEYPVVLMALLRSGVTAVPLNTGFPRRYAAALLKRIRCSQIILPAADADRADAGGMRRIFLEDIVQEGAARETAVPDTPAVCPPDREATIFFTSGSTGEPRAVLHTYGNHYYSAVGSNQNIAFQQGDRWLLSLPLFHVGGFAVLFRAALGGGAVVVSEEQASTAEAVAEFNITHLSLVATQMVRLLQEKRVMQHFSHLKAIILGGGPVPSSLIDQAVSHNLPVFTTYGNTEMASQICTTAPGDPPDRLLTAGRALKHRRCRIAPDGEIQVRGETLFKGYAAGGEIESAVDGEGWFGTGDMGYFDEQGCLIVRGRKDGMFISGGENIHPEEIEKQLYRLPGVVQAVVVPVRHREFGARPAAFIELRGQRKIDAAALKNALSAFLPKYMIPDYFYPIPLPAAGRGFKPGRESLTGLAEKLADGERSG